MGDVFKRRLGIRRVKTRGRVRVAGNRLQSLERRRVHRGGSDVVELAIDQSSRHRAGGDDAGFYEIPTAEIERRSSNFFAQNFIGLFHRKRI